ncbi:hypothetical protein [Laceyella tengchongensis]|uniref:hypothetical protein n=1 Tax=Laceyella tengchongensis TaxID=574699 RepID=UPI0012B77517|nr:hypothetical protein [Laceyella tengchongensis]
MAIKILQGFGAGFVVSIVLGYLFGAFGLIFNPIGPILLMCLTYLIAGWIAGYSNEHPYITAWLATTSLFFVNMFITYNVLGDPDISLLGIIFSWIFGQLGAWIGKATTKVY